MDSGFTEINLYLILHLFLILANIKFNICVTKSSCKDVGIFEYTVHHATICVKFDSCFYLDIVTTFEFNKNTQIFYFVLLFILEYLLYFYGNRKIKQKQVENLVIVFKPIFSFLPGKLFFVLIFWGWTTVMGFKLSIKCHLGYNNSFKISGMNLSR